MSQFPPSGQYPQGPAADGTRFPVAARIALVIVAVGSFFAALYLLRSHSSGPAVPTGGTNGVSVPLATAPPLSASPQIELGVAYGTEKRDWLRWAADEFKKTEEGKNIHVDLQGLGSLEAAQKILRSDEGSKKINVWIPASSLYKDIFTTEWQVKNGEGDPIAREEPIALTPMVYVMWGERYDAFAKKYGAVNWQTLGQALQEKGGWDAIAARPDWGLFKFGHTHPNQSNSGLMTLVLMAFDYHAQGAAASKRDLTLKDILDVRFQEWLQDFERASTNNVASTGTLMHEMVLKGPGSFDGLFVYESVAIEQIPSAENRWQGLKVIYPKFNLWSDNPYYILNTSWNTPPQRQAAEAFLNFLLSDRVQREALVHGFRPANLRVPVKFPESPFTRYADYGLKVDLGTMGQYPRAEVINNLLQAWQRSQGGK